MIFVGNGIFVPVLLELVAFRLVVKLVLVLLLMVLVLFLMALLTLLLLVVVLLETAGSTILAVAFIATSTYPTSTARLLPVDVRTNHRITRSILYVPLPDALVSTQIQLDPLVPSGERLSNAPVFKVEYQGG